MGAPARTGMTRSPAPRWARAPQLAELSLAGPIRRSRIHRSSRLVHATSADRRDSVILKLVGGAGSDGVSHDGSSRDPAPRPAAEVFQSIWRAGEIRRSHFALTRLLDVRWVPPYGYVTINEYLPSQPMSVAAPRLPLNRILVAAIHMLDALDFIHANDSCHGDICSDNVAITTSGEGYLLDFDLADASLALRRTRYPLAFLVGGTLAAWQTADVRTFAAMLTEWLELRRTALFKLAEDSDKKERELRSIRALAGNLATCVNAAFLSAPELSTKMSRAMRQVF